MFFVTSMVMLPLLCFLIVYLDRRVDRYLKNINTLQADQVEKNEYVHEIEKTIQIPQNSSATVGVVKDVESLKRLKKITKVSEGNVVLLFETMSIVYDPVNDTIIDISSNEK
ncbi:hypothetical protein HGA91_03265 [candidate division WWE3 bacterium]|nr:hypothetical protein [candidate division WWE3 bacterium]